MQLIARGQDDGRQQEIEEHLGVEAHGLADRGHGCQAQDQAHEHAGEDGQDRLVDGLDLARLQDVAREQGHDEQGDEDGQPP
jgi:hypothetical protein